MKGNVALSGEAQVIALVEKKGKQNKIKKLVATRALMCIALFTLVHQDTILKVVVYLKLIPILR